MSNAFINAPTSADQKGEVITTVDPAPALVRRGGSSLFRPEAMALSREVSWGRPMAFMPLSWRILTWFLVGIVVVAVAFITVGGYSRKETVHGYLRPSGGDLRIVPSTQGTVRSLLVQEGQEVKAGTPLAVISTARHLESGDALDDRMIEIAVREEEAVRVQLEMLERSATVEDEQLASQIESLKAERAAVLVAHSAALERRRIASERLDSARALLRQRFITQDEVARLEDLALAAQQSVAESDARQLNLRSTIDQIKNNQLQRPLARARERQDLQIKLANLASQRAQLQVARGYAVTSPIAGRVTALQVKRGDAVDPQRPLMWIVQPDAPLKAYLLVPSRAVAFVQPRQRVRLLYDAFPYQFFGAALGTVDAVSTSVVAPEDLAGPLSANEPVYMTVVSLDHLSVRAFGREVPLRSGMSLTADLILEQRSLAQWMFGPLLAVKSRLASSEEGGG